MNTNDYLNIIYTGIVENSKYLNGYIEREQKKAEKEFVKSDEFFYLLTDAINKIKNQFHNKHNINLNNYYRWMNRDQEALEDQKYHYPKDIPEIYGIGLPLLHLTAGRYTGHLHLKQVEDFEKKLLEVKNNSLMISVSIVNRNGEEFDLTKYDLVTNNVTPYFPEPKLIGNEYCIYEGATGNNRFQYFKISKKSNAGKYCKEFIEKYFKKNEYRHEYYNDAKKLIDACLTDALEKTIGLDAYLKYWNDCFTEADKLNQNIYSIQHFEALKEWYQLTFEKHVQENENKYLNEDVKKADILRWKDEKAKEVKIYLRQSERKGDKKYSAITSAQANELIKYFHWINNGENKTETIKPKITAPIIACFCYLVNESKLILKDESESIESYCKRVCKHYNLLYTINVRKNYLGSVTKRNKQKVESVILNSIPISDKEKIVSYINNTTKTYN